MRRVCYLQHSGLVPAWFHLVPAAGGLGFYSRRRLKVWFLQSLGVLFTYIEVTLGVLGSFMKHLGHQNRQKDVYDGDWLGVMGAKREAKKGPATNLQDFGATLGALWGYFWVMKMALGVLEGALGPFLAHFEITFGI